MTRILRLVVVVAATTLFLAACGGGASPAPTSAGIPTATPASQSTAPKTDAPGSVAPTTQPGGGGASDACALITADEAASALAATGTVTAKLTAGEPSYCSYMAGDALIMATSYIKKDGKLGYDAWKGSDGVQEITGLGVDAIFVPSTATLILLKGDTSVGITAGPGSMAEADRIEAAKKVGKLAAGRM